LGAKRLPYFAARIELRLDLVRALAADVLDGAAAEGGEAGAEDHAGIEQVGVRHHALVQAGHRLVEHGQDHALGDVFGRRVIGVHLGLDRLAVLPDVEALAVLLAALARLQQGLQARRDVQAEELGQDLANGSGHVQAHRVGQFDRAHRHAPFLRHLVQHRPGHALAVERHGLQQVGHQDAIDQEAGRALDRHRQLVDGLGEGQGTLEVGGIESIVGDDFDQRHHRHWIEEVQAEELSRARHGRAQGVEGDGRGVGGQQLALVELRFHLAVQILLGLEVLVDRLDHEIGFGHAGAVHIGLQAFQRLRDTFRRLQSLLEQRLGAVQGRLDVFHLTILQRRGETAQGAPSGNIPAHDAGAHHMHVFDAVVDAATQPLQLLLQEEHADQVARGRRLRQLGHGARLVPQSLADVAAATPGIDQGEGCGVLVWPHLGGRLSAHDLRQHLPHRPQVGRPGGETLGERS